MIGFRLHDLFNESGSTPSDTHRICDWSVFSSRLSDFQVCFFFRLTGLWVKFPTPPLDGATFLLNSSKVCGRTLPSVWSL